MKEQITHQKIKTRVGKIIEVPKLHRTKAIKLMCTQCMCYETHPKDCDIDTCPLFHFRGKTRLGND